MVSGGALPGALCFTGDGVFAQRDLPEGEVIWIEQAFVVADVTSSCPALAAEVEGIIVGPYVNPYWADSGACNVFKASVDMLLAAQTYLRLGEAERAMSMALPHPPLHSELPLVSAAYNVVKLLQCRDAAYAAVEEDELVRAVLIFAVASFSCSEGLGSALLACAGEFRHADGANATCTPDSNGGFVFYAAKDIGAGEEVTLDFLPEVLAFASGSVRAGLLWESRGLATPISGEDPLRDIPSIVMHPLSEEDAYPLDVCQGKLPVNYARWKSHGIGEGAWICRQTGQSFSGSRIELEQGLAVGTAMILRRAFLGRETIPKEELQTMHAATSLQLGRRHWATNAMNAIVLEFQLGELQRGAVEGDKVEQVKGEMWSRFQQIWGWHLEMGVRLGLPPPPRLMRFAESVAPFIPEAAHWIDRPSTTAMQHGRETPSEKEEAPSFLPKDWATPRIGRLRTSRVSAADPLVSPTRHNWGLSGSLVLGR